MKLVLDNQTRPYEVIRRIAESEDMNIDIAIAEGSVFQTHKNNIELIKQAAVSLGKRIAVVQDVEEMTHAMEPENNAEDETSQDEKEPDSIEAKADDSAEMRKKKGDKKKRRFGISPKKVLIVFFVLILVSAAGAAGYVYYYLPKGTVTLYVAEKVLDNSTVVTVNPNATQSDTENKVIPGQLIEVSFEDAETVSATGKKTVGEKATGSIELSNFTRKEIDLPVGTELVGATTGGITLNYVLSETVTIPRVTETFPDKKTQVLDAGTAEAAIEAVDIGEDYNVPAGTVFSVVDYDSNDVFGDNADAITGGFTKEVTVISADDQSKAEQQLKESMFAAASEKLKEQLKSGYSFKDSTIDNATVFVNYSNEVDEEVDEFTISLKVHSQVISYSMDDLEILLKGTVSNNVPENFEISEESIAVSVDQVTLQDGKLELKAKISSLVVPVLDVSAIQQDLLNKKPEEAEKILQAVEKIEGYDITLWPSLPNSLRTFPHIADRLVVDVKVKDAE